MAEFKNAAIFTPSFSYTYPGILSQELFAKPQIDTPAISDFAEIRQGIRSGERINLLTPLTSVLQAYSGCTPSYGSGGQISDRNLTVGSFDIALEWCRKDFESTANIIASQGTLVGDGLSGFELAGQLRQKFVESALSTAKIEVWKYLLFGNDASGNSPWNVIDGVFAKLFDGFGSYCIKPIGTDLPNQFNSVLTADQALNALKATFEGAPILLQQMQPSQKVFWVTGSMYNNLYASYESKQYGTELQFKYLVDGVPQLTYRGIQVRPLWVADQSLGSDTTNPFYNNLRHFIIYTTPMNHIVGVENASDLNNIEVFYDQRTRTTYLQGHMRFGYNYIHCDLTSIYY